MLDLKPGDEFTSVAADVTDDASVRLAVDTAAGRLGGLDILVNNAGIGSIGTVADNPDEEWHRVFDVNVVGIVRVTRAALPYLRASEHAAIVNTCSIAATAGLPQRALYSATKGAVLSLTLAMAADHVHEGIRVNCVNPGTADTPWVGRLLDQADDPAAERAALQRPAADGPAGHRGRGRGGHRLPGQPAGVVGHRNGAGDRRRHVRPADQAPLVTAASPDAGPAGRPALPLRQLGRSGVAVTEISFGGAAIGNLFTAVTDDDARAAVDAAWDGGIRSFDTAPHYGLGLSERRLGAALR